MSEILPSMMTEVSRIFTLRRTSVPRTAATRDAHENFPPRRTPKASPR